jgi:hypothetical protein
MVHARPPSSQHWHLSICPSVEKMLAALCTRNLSSACGHEVRACFTHMSAANYLPARCFLGGPKRWKYWVPYCQLDMWLVAVLQLGGHGIPSRQSLTSTQWFPYLWPHEEAPGCQTICKKCQHEYVAPRLQTRNTDFFYARIKALMPNWNKCLNVYGDQVKVQCIPSVTHESRILPKSEWRPWHQTVCYLTVQYSFLDHLS